MQTSKLELTLTASKLSFVAPCIENVKMPGGFGAIFSSITFLMDMFDGICVRMPRLRHSIRILSMLLLSAGSPRPLRVT